MAAVKNLNEISVFKKTKSLNPNDIVIFIDFSVTTGRLYLRYEYDFLIIFGFYDQTERQVV